LVQTKSFISGNHPDGVLIAPVGVRFDSTHFQDGTALNFKVEYDISDGQTSTTVTESRNIGSVYNKYSIRIVDEFENGQLRNGERMFGKAILNQVKASLESMNHKPGSASVSFSAQQIRADCETITAIHISAHGQNNGIAADLKANGTPIPRGQEGAITSTYIAPAVQRRDNLPPINIVFAASCSTGALASFAHGFGITNSPQCINRAYGGFNADGYIAGLQSGAEVFWNMLASGNAVEDTVFNVNMAYKKAYTEGKNLYGNSVDSSLDNVRFIYIGDGKAKLHGLYNEKGLIWHKD
jgi:hypothetical protein